MSCSEPLPKSSKALLQKIPPPNEVHPKVLNIMKNYNNLITNRHSTSTYWHSIKKYSKMAIVPYQVETSCRNIKLKDDENFLTKLSGQYISAQSKWTIGVNKETNQLWNSSYTWVCFIESTYFHQNHLVFSNEVL